MWILSLLSVKMFRIMRFIVESSLVNDLLDTDLINNVLYSMFYILTQENINSSVKITINNCTISPTANRWQRNHLQNQSAEGTVMAVVRLMLNF